MVCKRQTIFKALNFNILKTTSLLGTKQRPGGENINDVTGKQPLILYKPQITHLSAALYFNKVNTCG